MEYYTNVYPCHGIHLFSYLFNVTGSNYVGKYMTNIKINLLCTHLYLNNCGYHLQQMKEFEMLSRRNKILI